ncbi:MAG: hypothetical protein ACYC0J_09595 [Gammaproteobacteria bacterium]
MDLSAESEVINEIPESEIEEETTPPEKMDNASEKPADAPKRGRPRKGAPLGVEEEVIPEKTKRTYNKRAKSGGGFSEAAINQLAKQIEGIHLVGSMVTGIPELALDAESAKALSVAVVGVCQQYDLEISGKTGATIQLIGTAAVIYLPRYFAFRQRNAKDITPTYPENENAGG